MDYKDQTVSDLKAEMEKRDLKVPYNATKVDLATALEADDKKSKKSVKDDEPKAPHVDFNIKGPGDEGGKRRLFQLVPNEKIWLTKEEAKAHGLFWKN